MSRRYRLAADLLLSVISWRSSARERHGKSYMFRYFLSRSLLLAWEYCLLSTRAECVHAGIQCAFPTSR